MPTSRRKPDDFPPILMVSGLVLLLGFAAAILRSAAIPPAQAVRVAPAAIFIPAPEESP